MAEKEEKTNDIIYVFSQQLICKDCKDWYEHIDPLDKPDCDNCEDIADLPHISRQEAIERMAKANWIATVCAKNQCVPVDITKEQWDEEWEKLRIDYKKVYYAGAEDALNALLSE